MHKCLNDEFLTQTIQENKRLQEELSELFKQKNQRENSY